MEIVSVAGQIASGKDVLSDYLGSKLPGWKREAFGNGVKDIFMEAFGETWEFVEQWKRMDEIPVGYINTVRFALQQIGDGLRQIKPSVWVDRVFRGETPLVISDVRYLNEAQAVKDRGGISILLWRPGHENDIDHPSEAQLKSYLDWCAKYAVEGEIHHAWGAALDAFEEPTPKPADLFDLFIINSGSISDLYKKVDDIVIPYVEKKYG